MFDSDHSCDSIFGVHEEIHNRISEFVHVGGMPGASYSCI